MMIRYYKLMGKLPVPCSLEEFTYSFSHQDRQVAVTVIGPLRISTVFLGLDHNFFADDDAGNTRLFETMIFGDDYDGYQTRCGTWEEAEEMHAEAVAVAQAWVDKASETTKSAIGSDIGSDTE